jgi:Domain of unknown function (DUF4440)
LRPVYPVGALGVTILTMLAPALAMTPVVAQPPPAARTAAAVMKVEHEWLAALQQRDVATLARILGREFIDSDFQGDAITRAQFLGYFAGPAPHPARHPAPRVEQTFEDTKVRFEAHGNVAIVTGVVITGPLVNPKAGALPSPNEVRHSRFTDVFVWRDGRWQAVTGQETHFTPAKG